MSVHVMKKWAFIPFVCLSTINIFFKQILKVNCDMINRNESDVGDIGFEILAKRVLNFLCFILFLALTNYS